MMFSKENNDGSEIRIEIVVTKKRVQELFQELDGGSSLGNLGLQKTLAKITIGWAVERIQKIVVVAMNIFPLNDLVPDNTKMQQYNLCHNCYRCSRAVPQRHSGNCYLLVIMDYFNQWSEATKLS